MNNLLDILIDRGVVGYDAVVTLGDRSRHRARDYTVTGIEISAPGYELLLRAIDGTQCCAVRSGEIVAIDGMAVERYADVYNINMDGSLRSVGKKRGRKPKVR